MDKHLCLSINAVDKHFVAILTLVVYLLCSLQLLKNNGRPNKIKITHTVLRP